MTEMERRMDRFDAVITEYLRSNRKTTEYLADRIGCSTATLWRYRTQILSFERAHLAVIANCFRIANVSNEDLRYILGLPTGKADEN